MEEGRGRVVFYDPEANYGFIDPDGEGGDIVFSIRPGEEPVQLGDYVHFELAPKPAVTQMGTQALRVWKTTGAPSSTTDMTVPS